MAKNPEPFIVTTVENGIQKVVLNRPAKKNAINRQMYLELTKILDESANNEKVTLLAITGKGDFYSSGNDFISFIQDGFSSEDGSEIVKTFIDKLILYPKISVAIVNGPAIGIMCTTLLLFDIVYASEKAYFLTPFCKLGISAEGCSTYTFPKIMGPSKAGEMLYFCEKLSAGEADKVGFISRVYKTDALHEVWKHLEKISALSKESLMATKTLLRRWNQDFLLKVNEEEIKVLKDFYNSPTLINNMMEFMSRKSKL